jgi:hypothetical protein
MILATYGYHQKEGTGGYGGKRGSSGQSGFANGMERMEEARAAFQSIPEERSISAMPVVVHYVAMIGDVRLTKRGEEYIFAISPTLSDGSGKEHWEEIPQNAFAIRDEFLKIQSPSEALDFLAKTGQFSPLDFTVTWREIRKWQRFTYLVQEHTQLARAMNERQRTGECAEALKALSGIYESSFFTLSSLPESLSETSSRLRFEEQVRRNRELNRSLQEGERDEFLKRRALCSWFRQPPGEARSIEWIPKSTHPEDEKLIRKLRAGGAMIEYLVPRDRLQPILLIRPAYTLEAIAASIFADRANGVEYRSCECCKELFPIGSHKTKLYCNKERCKNTAHQRRKRANARARKLSEKATNKSRTTHATKRVERK